MDRMKTGIWNIEIQTCFSNSKVIFSIMEVQVKTNDSGDDSLPTIAVFVGKVRSRKRYSQMNGV